VIKTIRLATPVALCALCWPAIAPAQMVGPTPAESNSPAGGQSNNPLSASETAQEDWAVHGQSTFVVQYHPGFSAAFSGPQSLDAHEQGRETFDATLFAGVRPWQGAEIWVNPEIDQGFGLSKTLGVAGFPSGEAFKLGASDPYVRLQRVFLRQTIDLGGDAQTLDSEANQLAGKQTANRVVITIGKFGLPDIFDRNQYADDPKHTFLNWSIFDAGSWDYAADAWGYTYGAAVEWYQDWWTLRSALVTLSAQPNTKALDTRLFDQYQFDEEVEERHKLLDRDGVVRLLGFLSHGQMGDYNEATSLALQTGQPANIAAVRSTHNRGGLSLNAEQALTDDLGMFARAGWSQGGYEDFDYTDIDKTLSGGLSLKGIRWGRPDDVVGLAGAVNDTSAAAKRFFAAGGLGILAGDGQLLHSGPEKIVETYYSLAAFSFATLTLDYQFIVNPAYNRDRGPVSVLGARVHVEF
jgi:high affinity Mn2+ porin